MFNCWPPTERHNREKTSLFQWLKWISVGNKRSGEIPVLDLFPQVTLMHKIKPSSTSFLVRELTIMRPLEGVKVFLKEH